MDGLNSQLQAGKHRVYNLKQGSIKNINTKAEKKVDKKEERTKHKIHIKTCLDILIHLQYESEGKRKKRMGHEYLQR